MGQLVHRGCGKPVPRMQAPEKSRCEQHRAIVMNGGIAKVRGGGIPAVDGMNALEVAGYLVKSFVPADALPTAGSAPDRMSEPVFIVVKILQGDGFRADVAAAERVVFVAANVETLVGLNGDLDAADRFAEIAGAVMN